MIWIWTVTLKTYSWDIFNTLYFPFLIIFNTFNIIFNYFYSLFSYLLLCSYYEKVQIFYLLLKVFFVTLAMTKFQYHAVVQHNFRCLDFAFLITTTLSRNNVSNLGKFKFLWDTLCNSNIFRDSSQKIIRVLIFILVIQDIKVANGSKRLIMFGESIIFIQNL